MIEINQLLHLDVFSIFFTLVLLVFNNQRTIYLEFQVRYKYWISMILFMIESET